MRIVDDPEETAAIREFARGVRLPLVTLHFERGDLNRAAAIARLALGMDAEQTKCGRDEPEEVITPQVTPPRL